MIARTAIATAGLLAAAACATAQAPGDGAPAGKCDNSNIQQFVGQQATADLGAKMKQVSGASTIRWVPNGTAVTMEFSPDRLTVFLDANNRVERISCS